MSSTTIAPPEPAPAPVLYADAEAASTDAPPSTLAGSVAADMSLLAAPTTGRFRARVDSGIVGPGTVVGVVTGGGGRADEVLVPVAAEVCGLLALDGQLVQAGQALAWIRRVAT